MPGSQYSLLSKDLRTFFIGRANEAGPLEMGKPRKPDGKNYLPKVAQQVWGRAKDENYSPVPEHTALVFQINYLINEVNA